MALPSASQTSALIAESSPLLRQAVRMALNNLGIKNIAESSSISSTYEHLKKETFDLVILNSDIDNSDAFFLVKELRRGKLGVDIFSAVILVLTKNDEFHVKGAVNSGADAAVLVPFAPDQLMAKISALMQSRAPFIVTHDYIGPDRRKQTRSGPSARTFTAPNPLKARTLALPETRYKAIVAQVRSDIFAERVKRLAHHLEWGSRDLAARARDGLLTADYSIPNLFVLEAVTEELIERLEEDGTAVDDLEGFRSICLEMKSAASKAAYRDFEVLHEKARKITSRHCD